MVRSLADRYGGERVRRLVAAHLVAVGAFFVSTGQAAYQDAPSLLERAERSTPRWRATLVAAPYGSVHQAKVALPIAQAETVADEPVGVSYTAAGADGTLILEPDAETLTGSVPPPETDKPVFATAVRETKGDLLMSRAGIAGRVRVGEEKDGLRRAPRMLIDSPEKALPPTSFLRPRPSGEGEPIQLASLEFDHAVLRQQLLETPLEAVARRRIEERELARNLHCMATAIYFEARGEPERGQRAVAQVVLNRVADYRYPGSICDVVYQNQHRRNRCQFSFACDGRPERIRHQRSWALAMTVAEEAVLGEYFLNDVGGSTHYHANYVHPRWGRLLTRMDRIGRHIFYKLKPGQT